MTDPLTLRPSIDEISRLRAFVVQATTSAGMGDSDAHRLRLALEEAVVNVVGYGHATAIVVSAEVADGRLLLTIDDDGLPFDPTQGSQTDMTVPADERQPGGLGIILMQKMTDRLSYERVGGHNILRMEKAI